MMAAHIPQNPETRMAKKRMVLEIGMGTDIRGTDVSTEIVVQQHFFTPGIAVPGFVLPGLPQPGQPRFLPDSRSMLISVHYSLAPLPDVPMATRAADPRVGLFTTTVLDFNNDLPASPRQRFVNRWRLEKKDPNADVSDPVKPITFWIDRNVPHAYRETVRGAILEWNKAFERIGFRNAITVEQQPDDARFDTLDPGYPSVRWLMNAEPGITAIGQTQIDPRTGEIVDADISFEGMFVRAQRYMRTQLLAARQAVQAATVPTSAGGALREPFASVIALPGLLPPDPAQVDAHADTDHAFCRHGDAMAEQAQYALDLMDATGELEPGSPLAQQFVLDYLKDTVMHEVGHALGLRHNFRASRAYTEAQLADPEFTRANGTTGSVMEYNAINLARPGQTGGVPFQMTLGPYDYWAIEYAYKPFAPDQEGAALQRIAARSNEPLLAYGTDEDAAFGIDPETIQLDLGADPIVYAAKRLEIARDLFQRQERRELKPDQSYAVLRRSLAYAIADAGRAVGVLVRQIGGVRTLRDHPGSGRDPLQPADAATQRAALDLIARHVLAIDGLAVTPTLQRRLAPDFDDRGDNPSLSTDYPVPQRLLDLQRAVLNQLMSDAVAARILDSVDKTDRPYTAFQLSELYERLTRDVWRELVTGGNISATRRELQRDHVNRLATALLRPSPQARADARSLLRQQALLLQGQLHKALQREPKLDAATRAHLQDSADTLAQALEAKMQRVGV